MKKAEFYKKINKNKVQCTACNHFCTIETDKTGICGIRKNVNGKLYLLTYSKTISANVDPIEKKPLYHFLPGSRTFSFGTIGCNFRCANCLNYDISQMFDKKGKIEEYHKIPWGKNYPPQIIVKEAEKHHCSSIAYTYNEPTVFAEYALDTMKLAHKNNLKNVWVSNGYMSKQVLDKIIPHLDAVNIDIKSFEDDFYSKNCGGRLQPILDNCKKLAKQNVWLEITTLIIPTLSDDPKMLQKIAEFIKKELGESVPWHVTAFSGRISWKLQHLPSTKPETLKKAYKIGKKAGLKYVYAGNVPNTGLETTKCPNCQTDLIKRTGFSATKTNFDQGKCKQCQTKIEGIWK